MPCTAFFTVSVHCTLCLSVMFLHSFCWEAPKRTLPIFLLFLTLRKTSEVVRNQNSNKFWVLQDGSPQIFRILPIPSRESYGITSTLRLHTAASGSLLETRSICHVCMWTNVDGWHSNLGNFLSCWARPCLFCTSVLYSWRRKSWDMHVPLLSCGGVITGACSLGRHPCFVGLPAVVYTVGPYLFLASNLQTSLTSK